MEEYFLVAALEEYFLVAALSINAGEIYHSAGWTTRVVDTLGTVEYVYLLVISWRHRAFSTITVYLLTEMLLTSMNQNSHPLSHLNKDLLCW